MTIETEIAALTVATTDLITEVVDQKDTLAAQATAATNSASAAASSASAAASSASAAATSEANAAAVVTGGTASLTPAAGLIPLADGTGKIANGWLPNNPAFSGEIAANGGIALGDNDKATFGASDDLQIYHDGSNSIIYEGGTGDLQLRGNGGSTTIMNGGGTETLANFGNNGSVDLYYDNALKLSTTATGIDISGTATMDGLTVSKTYGSIVKLESTGTGPGAGVVIGDLQFYGNDASAPGAGIKASITATTVAALGDDSQLMFSTSDGTTNNVNRMLIANNGDVSLYEDTGTTPKFVWDSSAESLGLNNINPSATYSVDAAKGIRVSAAAPSFTLQETDAANQTWLMASYAGSFAIRDTTVAGSTYPFQIEAATPSNTLYLDSTGNLLVGKTSANSTTVGTQIEAAGAIAVTRDGSTPLYLNRKTSDGEILAFRKDGTTVGSIGTVNGDLLVGTGDTGLRFHDGDNRIYPINTSGGSKVDATIDLGDPTGRFKNLYLSSGVYLGGTGAANHLDDYEEGTWTPVYTADSGAATHNVQTGSYVKVGKLVTVIGELQASRNTLSGAVTITGLPFASSGNGGGFNPTFTIRFASDMPNLKGYTSASSIVLKKQATSSTNSVDVIETDLSNTATNYNYLYFTATYMTA